MGELARPLEERIKAIEEHLLIEQEQLCLHYDPAEGWSAWLSEDEEHEFAAESLSDLVEELEREFGLD